MRTKLLLTLLAVVIPAVLLLAPLASGASLHCKGTMTRAGIPSQTVLNLDDIPGHTVQLTITHYDITSTCPELDGSRMVMRTFADFVKGSGSTSTYTTVVTKGGDLIFRKSSGTAQRETRKDGSYESRSHGVWEFTGGTGRFQGIKGNGSWGGRATEEGGWYEWEGDIEFP